MKYESDILKRLIKTYGVVGNPRYISEIIKEFIVRGKECFPNLFTYQADWLAHIDEFGLNPTYTVSYTGQSIYAPNTLEKPVKSAILKGNTGYRDIDTGEILETFEEGRNLELVSVKMPVLMTYSNLFTGFVAFGYIGGDGNVVELQENILSDFIEIHEKTIAFRTFRENGEPSTRYGEFAFYDNNKNFIGRKISSDTTDEYTTVPDGTKYVRIWSVPLDGLGLNTKGMMIYTKDKPSLAITKYLESNKTNILSTPEDLELRGIGDVRDELNCLTGEVVERIGEVVLDGSENWKEYIASGTSLKRFVCEDKILNAKSYSEISNILPNNGESWTKDITNLSIDGVKKIVIQFNSSDSRYNYSLNEFKQWLSQNPITVQYQLATESIKTVDLNILDQNGENVKQLMTFNGGTHFNTGSLEGSPLPSLEVSVETDLEETLAVCSLEGNTM